ncbi:MAG: efflux RND transporter permease subunit [Gammaproteobacteria bacterium]|nr:efflux RND transporter permease subunit [Gammaproteobacteria bacterium]
MNFSAWMAHRRSILFFLFMLAAAGLVAAFKLPVTLFPNVDFPRVLVSLDAGDRPAEQMEVQVTMPVEEAIRRVPGVQNVRSTTSRGSAEISVNFAWGTDMPLAASLVSQAAAQILPQLPAGTQIATKRMDPTVFPILAYSITSDVHSLTALHDLAQYQLRPLLSGVEGVARIQVVGGAIEEYHVIVDPARLQAYGLAMGDVSRALAAANVVTAVGRLEDHYKLYLGIADTRLKSLDDIRQTVLKTGANGLVRLEDVAGVVRSTVPQWIRVNADGHDAVLLQVYQQPGSNSVQIARSIKAKLDAYSTRLPRNVKIANWYDQSQLVIASAASVRDAIMIGIGLAALVLLAFLRNLKITLIAIIVVPAVLSATVVLLTALHMSFNIMTLGGMAAAVGLIIDDAIVMIEHIVRRLRGAADHHGRVLDAAREFLRPLTGSSASTVIIFIPLAFLEGVTGAFFKALSLTMAAGLIISFMVTWLAVPILADHLLNEKDAKQKEGGRLTEWMHGKYDWIMRRILARPMLILVGIMPLMALGWVAFHQVGSGFMPSMDEGGFILDYRSEPGTSLAETDRLLRQVESIIRANPNVDTYSRRTGTQLGGILTEANEGDFFIRLKPEPRAPIDEVMSQIRIQVEQQVSGLNIEMAQLMEDLIGDLTAVPQPIQIKIFSDDTALLQSLAEKTAAAIARIKGVVEIRNGINPAGDALDIKVDRVKASLEGVDPEAVTRMVQDALAGQVTTQIRKGVKMIGVRVWVPEQLRSTENDLGQLLLRAPDGHLFPLKRVARISTISGQPQIGRENFKRMVAVTARISGRDMGSTIADVKQVMDAPNMLPQGVYYELGGLYQQQQIAFKGLIAVFAAAVALVFLLLLFLYERFQIALSIMAIPLLSISAVFVGLRATGIELNISAMMGMTMIVGIVTEVAIFYFSELQSLPAGMVRTEALIVAGKNRMRPIAMTTLAAILTLLPLALAIGQGSAMQQPLAIAIISGLVVQLPLVLLAMPVLFSLLDKTRHANGSA